MGGTKYCSSFIRIKHGENEESIFNPDCSMKMLVENIRKRCSSPPFVELALVEVREGTNGAVTFPSVTELPANMDNGRSYFEDRGTYVLLSLLRREERVEYESLLDDDYMIQELKDKIHDLNNPKASAGRRPGRISKIKPPPSMGSRSGRRATLAPPAAGSKGRKFLLT